jgi:hypothetical protein
LPHPCESSVYYESLLSPGASVSKRHDRLAACVGAVKRLIRRKGDGHRPSSGRPQR